MIEDLINTSKIKLITESAYPLDEAGDDYQPLLKLVGDAIGVVHKPEFERHTHYFNSSLPKHFDAVIHSNQSRAVEPTHQVCHWSQGTEAPESYPTGL